ncbi:hypothetical protein SK128_014720, partial [Halocaridina rubra]
MDGTEEANEKYIGRNTVSAQREQRLNKDNKKSILNAVKITNYNNNNKEKKWGGGP